jgi:hypothetical protein
LKQVIINPSAERKNRKDLVKYRIGLDEARYAYTLTSREGLLWADEKHTQQLYELMLLAIGANVINPLKEEIAIDENGKQIIDEDGNTKYVANIDITGLKPHFSEPVRKEMQEAIKRKEVEENAKKKAQTAPYPQGNDEGR